MFTAWSMRRAFHEEGEAFNTWLISMADDEAETPDVAIDPAAMRREMPEIPVAGLAEGVGHLKNAVSQSPEAPDAEQDDNE